MNVAIVRTKAEQALAAHFDAVAGKLPGDAAMRRRREQAIGVVAARGLPSRRVEEWKFTDLRARIADAFPPVVGGGKLDDKRLAKALGKPLAKLAAVTAVFVNGRLASWSKDPLVADDPRVRIEALHKAPSTATLAPADEIVTALNAAFATDGAVVDIADGAQLDVPIHLVFLSDLDAPGAIATRNVVRIGSGAAVTLIESHIGVGAAARQATAVGEIALGKEARLQHVRIVAEGEGAVHLATSALTLGAGAAYTAHTLTHDTGLVRNQHFVTFAGEGAEIAFHGAALGRGKEHVDTTLVIDHAVPRCTSRERFKAVLDGEARAVFQGKVIVRPDAQKTDGKQMAQALLLSETAEFDAKPELEIYADDVVCGHGATSGALDHDMLFYLRARGIPEPQARAMLIEAFVAEIFDAVEDASVKAALAERVTGWLSHRSGA